MIKLSDVKVRPQYRAWVRHRLTVLEYASQHGPAAAGRHYQNSARTIRRWRKRWRAAGVEGLVSAYPRHRPRRVPPVALELTRHARQELGYGAARTRLWLQRVHGRGLSFAFVLGVEAAGIRHRYIRPRRPQQNGKVERSPRIDQEEFWGRQRFPDFEAAAAALRTWETRYNYDRFSLALRGRTPAEKLAAFQPPRRAA